jgi:phospholipase/carboxylesterase
MQLVHMVFEPQGDGPHPTILALHGRGANAFDLACLAPELCAGRCLVLCPQGPVVLPLGQGRVGYAWYPSTGGDPDPAALATARQHVEDFLNLAMTRYPIDPQHLMLLGFSQGGVLAYTLALQTPARFTALAALSTWLPASLQARLRVLATQPFPRTLVHHGMRDQRIEVARAQQSVDAFRTAHLPITYREYDMDHEITRQSLADLSTWIDEQVCTPTPAQPLSGQ